MLLHSKPCLISFPNTYPKLLQCLPISRFFPIVSPIFPYVWSTLLVLINVVHPIVSPHLPMFILQWTLLTTLSYPCFNRFSQICLNLPAFQPTFALRLTHVSPHWLVSSNYGFRSVTPSSWNTRTTSTSIMDQIKEIKNLFSLFPFLVCIIYIASTELIIV